MNLVNQPLAKHKLGLLDLAEELGNVSPACRIMGVSRDTLYVLPQTNGICERFHKTHPAGVLLGYVPQKKSRSIDELQADLDVWIGYYNHERTHQGKMCCGRTPMATFTDDKKIWQEKLIG